jgi:hypothetical protein
MHILTEVHHLLLHLTCVILFVCVCVCARACAYLLIHISVDMVVKYSSPNSICNFQVHGSVQQR